MMRRKIMFAASLALVSITAFAGYRQPVPVEVDLDNQFALGDMLTAATDKSDLASIGCGTRSVPDGVGGIYTFGFCQAQDATGVYCDCFTENADLIQAIRGISDYSFISFGWDVDGNCTRIGISTQSFYLDKPK